MTEEFDRYRIDRDEPYNELANPPMWFTVCLALAILIAVMAGWHWWHQGCPL
jgi:hypothetical protein